MEVKDRNAGFWMRSFCEGAYSLMRNTWATRMCDNKERSMLSRFIMACILLRRKTTAVMFQDFVSVNFFSE